MLLKLVEIRGEINVEQRDRIYGLDLLKVYSMFLVVILHALGRWKLLDLYPDKISIYYASWMLETFAYCAVDVFALLTGYLSYKNKNKHNISLNLKRLLLIWVTIVFYASCNIGVKLILGEDVNLNEVKLSMLPLTMNTYWYFTVYVGLFFILPIIINGVNSISDKSALSIMIITFPLFTIGELNSGYFSLISGYSFAWIAILAMWGAILCKLQIASYIHPLIALLCVVGLTILSWYLKIFQTGRLAGDNMVNYLSPSILVIAFLWICIFEKININNKKIKKIALMMGNASFSIFVFNTDRFLYDRLVHEAFVCTPDMTGIKIITRTIACAVLFVLGVLIIDFGRQILFKRIAQAYKMIKI